MKITEYRIKFIEFFKQSLKHNGFKKIGNSWFREKNGLVQVFNMQASQFFCEEFFINVGIGILDLMDKKNPPEYKCNIRNRIKNLEQIEPEEIINNALKWFSNYDSLSKLLEHFRSNTLPVFTTEKTKEYLKNYKE